MSAVTQNGFLPVTYRGTDGWAFAEYLDGVVKVDVGSLAEAVNALASEAPFALTRHGARNRGHEPLDRRIRRRGRRRASRVGEARPR